MTPHNLTTLTKRPKLTADTVVEFLDWLVENADSLSGQKVAMYMQAAELTIRTLATEAQAKDTQHTLVRDGVIAPPAPVGA